MTFTSMIVIFIIEILFHLFHLSVLILLVKKRRTVYKGHFYLIFIIVLTADIACFIIMIICRKIPQFGFLLNFYKTNETFASIIFNAISYLTAIQFLGHTLMAFNRFTLIWLPIKHQLIWKNQWWYIAIIIIFPLIHISVRLHEPGVFVFLTDEDVSVSLKNANALSWYFAITSVLYLGTTFIAAILNLLSFTKFCFHKNSSTAINVNEINLLFVSIVVFIAQLLRSTTNIQKLLFPSNPGFAVFFTLALPYFNDIFALSGSVSLLILSKITRKEYYNFYTCKSSAQPHFTKITPSIAPSQITMLNSRNRSHSMQIM